MSSGSNSKRKRLDLGPGAVGEVKSRNIAHRFVGEAEAKMSGTNPWTGKPYSQKYYDILKTRQNLPVYIECCYCFVLVVLTHGVHRYAQKEEFNTKLNAGQSMVLVGETGSTKLIQPSLFHRIGTTHAFR